MLKDAFIFRKRKTEWCVKLSFEIGLHVKDRDLLKQIQDFFGVGNLRENGSVANFRIESVKELAKVIEHFDKYTLITKKAADYILFEKAYRIFLKKEHLDKEGLALFVGIKATMNKGLSYFLKYAFPNVPAIEKFNGVETKIHAPQWISGFTSGEGNFSIRISNSTKSKSYV
jgi:hypothetical protein